MKYTKQLYQCRDCQAVVVFIRHPTHTLKCSECDGYRLRHVADIGWAEI